jgi:hypothetical protein
MNSDVIRVIYGFLPDCRGAALTCAEWYAAYTGGADYAYWAGGRSLATMLPKMYGTVWRGSIYTLAAAGNRAVIHSIIDQYSRVHWERIGIAAAGHGHVDLVLGAIAMGGRNIDVDKIWAAGARDTTVAVWAEWHRITGKEIPAMWLEYCCVETLRWYFEKFIEASHQRDACAFELCSQPCVGDVRVLQYLHEIWPGILRHNISLCSTILDAAATDALRYLVENGGDVVSREDNDEIFRRRLSTRPLGFTKYIAGLFYSGDPYERMFKCDTYGAALAILDGDSVSDIAAMLTRLPQYRTIVIMAAIEIRAYETVHALMTKEEFMTEFPDAIYPDETYADKYARIVRDNWDTVWSRAAYLEIVPFEVLDKIMDIILPTPAVLQRLFNQAARGGSLDAAVEFFQRHNWAFTEQMIDTLADCGRFDLVAHAHTTTPNHTARVSDTVNA